MPATMPVSEPPASVPDLIETAGSHARTAVRLASEALGILESGPPGTASAFMGMALLEFRDALLGVQLELSSARALVEIGEEIRAAKDRARTAAERAEARSHLCVVRDSSPDGKEPATVG